MSAVGRFFRFVKSGSLQLSPTDIENSAASALVASTQGLTLWALATDKGVEHIFAPHDSTGAEGVAFSIARSICARSEEVAEVPDVSNVRHVAKLQHEAGTDPLLDTQSGADFTTLSKIIGDILMPSEWIGISVRPAKKQETKRQVQWLDFHGLRTHHSRKSGARVIQVFAGSNDPSRAKEIPVRVAAGIPGFGLNVEADIVSNKKELAILSLLGAVSAAASFLFAHLENAPLRNLLTVTSVLPFVAALFTMYGYLPSKKKNLFRHLRLGTLPSAPLRKTAPKKPTSEKQRYDATGSYITKHAFSGDYPLARSAFLVGPHIPLAFVAPHSGTSSGGANTKVALAPIELHEAAGPPIGSNAGQNIHLSADDMWSGIGIFGQAGSGKTALMERMWGWLSEMRTQQNFARISMIAFDTKGDAQAAHQYQTWSRANNDRAVLFDVFDPNENIGIELFPDLGESALEWARSVTNALRYIWGSDSIGPESFDTLTRIFAAAKCVDAEVTSKVTLRKIRPAASAFYYANILLSNEGDELGVELAAALGQKATQRTDTDLREVVSVLEPLYGAGVTASRRLALTKAPRTKVAALMSAEHWFSRPKRAPWSFFLQKGAAIIVNTGQTSTKHLPDDKLRVDLSGLLLYTLHESIKRTCSGWFDEGKQVYIFADELKNLALAGSEVVTWFRHDARAYGVCPVFATQTPETLVESVRHAVLGFGTLIFYAQADPKTVREMAQILSLAGGCWETGDIVNLDRFEAIVCTTAHGKKREPFPVRIPNYRQIRDQENVSES